MEYCTCLLPVVIMSPLTNEPYCIVCSLPIKTGGAAETALTAESSPDWTPPTTGGATTTSASDTPETE